MICVRNISVLLWLFAGGLFSCHSKEESSYKVNSSDTATNALRNVVSILNADNGKKFTLDNCDNVLIIPIDEGCESCTLKAITFSLTSPRENLLVIISSSSKKVFTQKIRNYAQNDNSLLSAKNKILIDSSNLCFNKGISDIMPRIYQVRRGSENKQIMLDASDIDKELKSL